MPPRRARIAWLPLLLALALLTIIAYIAVTRWPTLAAEHPADPVTLAVVGVGALLTVIVALVRSGRRYVGVVCADIDRIMVAFLRRDRAFLAQRW